MKQFLRSSILLCTFLSVSAVINGQVQFLDTRFNIVSTSNEAKYTRELTVNNDSTCIVTVKYLTGVMMMIGSYTDLSLEVENGDFYYYYSNGNPESEGRFKQGIKVGVWKRWNFDGTKKPDRYYPDEDFKTTSRTTTPAKFLGGVEALHKLISDSLRYPKEARDRGLEGTVYVAFTIDATGKIKRPEVSGGMHYLLNEEALRFVSVMPVWIPASKNGIAVDSNFVMPIVFNIGNRATENIQKPAGPSKKRKK